MSTPVRLAWDGMWVRRGLGFRIKPVPGSDRCELTIRRHGKDKQRTLQRGDLERLMSLNRFRPAAEAAGPAWLGEREADDLIYYADRAVERTTAGAPIDLSSGLVALRSSVALTLAVADQEEVSPWVFMPRRRAFEGRFVAGCRFASMECGSEAYACDLLGDERFGAALLELLPLLDGRWRASQIVAQHSRPTLAEWMLAWLNAGALLESVASPPRLATPLCADTGYVTWLGHACVVVKVGAATVLVDPLFFHDSEPRRGPRPPDPRALPPIDAVLITHGDNDHLNPHGLARLPKATHVIAPRVEPLRPYQVDIEAVVAALGFTHSEFVVAGETVQLGDVRVHALPFVGEDWGLHLAKVTYLIEGPLGRVYLSADAAPMPEVCADLATKFAIDFAFLGVSGCEEPLVAPPRFGYGEFYAMWLPHARRNEWQQHCSGPADAATAARALRCKRAFGYAAGSPTMEMAHSDRGSHAELAALLTRPSDPTAIDLGWGTPHLLR